MPISTRYPVIEISMALIVLMLVDAFCIGQARSGLSVSRFGLTDHLAHDWPILAAHITLFACLLPMAAIDLEHYWVDIRFTNFATVTGFICHALWTPKHSESWIRPADTTAVMSLFVVVGLAITWIVLTCQPRDDADEPPEEEPVEESDGPGQHTWSPRRLPPSLASSSRAAAWIAGVLLVGMLVALTLDEVTTVDMRHAGRALLPLGLFFALIVWEGSLDRPADHQIAAAIHEERHEARRMVLGELALLLPAVVMGGLGIWLMTRGESIPDRISGGLHASVRIDAVSMMRNWAPLYGLATAASGYVIAGALGWVIRIVFTLIFGKEAFGVGDIHLMAAAGCVAGWPVVALSFFLTCVLAVIGWIVALPFKRTRALPLGPWLSLSFLVVVLFYDSILRLPIVARMIEVVPFLLFGQPTAG